MAFLWLINGGDPKYLLSGMILQVVVATFKLISKKSDQQDPLNGHRKNMKKPEYQKTLCLATY